MRVNCIETTAVRKIVDSIKTKSGKGIESVSGMRDVSSSKKKRNMNGYRTRWR